MISSSQFPLFYCPAQDLLLSILREDERIMLAPNSSQVPPLMPTQQNVFNPGVGPADVHEDAGAEAVTEGEPESLWMRMVEQAFTIILIIHLPSIYLLSLLIRTYSNLYDVCFTQFDTTQPNPSLRWIVL